MPSADDTQELPSTPPTPMVTVYDKEGVAHRMTPLNAHDMVQHVGWSRSVAVREVPQTPKIVVLVSKTAATVDPSAETEQIDMATLSDDELRAFAEKHFEMKFEPHVSRADVLDALLQEKT